MHIVEIVLMILVVFFLFTQIASIPRLSTDWSKVRLYVLGNDIIHTLNERGIDWFNETAVKTNIDSLNYSNIIYSVKISNAIKTKINMSCFCDDYEFGVIKNALYPGWFVFNGKNITFELNQIPPNPHDPNHFEIGHALNLGYDVLIITHNYTILSNHRNELKTFLESDKGILEYFNFNETSMFDNIQREIFGVNESYVVGPVPVNFSDGVRKLGSHLNKINKYFSNFPVLYDDFYDTSQWSVYTGSLKTESIGLPGPSLNMSAGDFIYSKDIDSFGNGTIDFDVNIANGGVLYFLFRMNKSDNYKSYAAGISANMSHRCSFYNYTGGNLTQIGSNENIIISSSQWKHVRIIIDNTHLKLYINEKKVAEAEDNKISNKGRVGMFINYSQSLVDNLRVKFGSNHVFKLWYGSNVTQIDNNKDKTLLYYRGTVNSPVIINYNIFNGNGRTAWISSKFARDPHDFPFTWSKERDVLLKSILVWLAGDEYRLIGPNIKEPVSVSVHKVIDKDTFQPVRIELILGYAY